MMIHKITNILNTSITIEDLGLRLSAGESRNITAEAYSKSEDIKKNARFIRVDAIYAASLGTTGNSNSEKPIVTIPIQKNESIPVVVNDTAHLEKKLDDIYSMLSTLTNQKSQSIQSTQVVTGSFGTIKDPMFIPSSIVPVDVEVSTKASEQQVDKDIDDSKNSLRKLRKKS